MSGFFQVGIYHPKREVNVGGLYRSAHLFDAAGVFTVGRRYSPQATDTSKAARHLPLVHYTDIDDLIAHLPHAAPLIAVELTATATPLTEFEHPRQAVYLFGAEDHGLPAAVLDRAHHHVVIEAALPWSMNVAQAGAVVLHHRHTQQTQRSSGRSGWGASTEAVHADG